LTIAGDILLDRKTDYIDLNDFRSIFWTTDLFSGDADERDSKSSKNFVETKKDDEVSREIPQIIRDLGRLQGDQATQLGGAVEYLITLLSRAGWIEIELVAGNPKLIKITQFNGDVFTIENLRTPLSSVLPPSKREQRIVKTLEVYKPAYLSALSSDLRGQWLNAFPSDFSFKNEGSLEKMVPVPNLTPFWDSFREAVKSVPYDIIQEGSKQLSAVLGATFEHEIKHNGVLILRSGAKVYQVAVNLGQSLELDYSDKDKTFILHDPKVAKLLYKPSKKVLRLDMRKDWSNWSAALDEIGQRIVRDQPVPDVT
jgi:hypothetical protein